MFNKKDLYLFLTLVLIFAGFYLFSVFEDRIFSSAPLLKSDTHPRLSDAEISVLGIDIKEYNNIIVEVEGEVVNPGIYAVEKGASLKDLIKNVCILLPHAKEDINLNILIYEDTYVYIPKSLDYEKYSSSASKFLTNEDLIKLPPPSAAGTEKQAKSGLININTASKEELMSLPGIGPAIASSIIEYRLKNKFQKIEDIQNVPRIGEKTFERLKEQITVK